MSDCEGLSTETKFHSIQDDNFGACVQLSGIRKGHIGPDSDKKDNENDSPAAH